MSDIRKKQNAVFYWWSKKCSVYLDCNVQGELRKDNFRITVEIVSKAVPLKKTWPEIEDTLETRKKPCRLNCWNLQLIRRLTLTVLVYYGV